MSTSNHCQWRDTRRRIEKAKRRHQRSQYKGRRTDLPRRVMQAADLSDYKAQFSERWLLDTLPKQHFWPLIEHATRQAPHKGPGRPPLEGSWALFLCAFLFSKELSLTAFAQSRTQEFWEELGFLDPPSKGAIWDNLARIERDCLGVFADGAWFFFRRLDRALDGDVGRDWWWDCTVALSPSRWFHCCDKKECPRRQIEEQRKRHRADPEPSPYTPSRAAIRRAKALPDDPDADDGGATAHARSQNHPDNPEAKPEKTKKPKAGGIPNLESRRAIITRLYGAQEADQDAARLEGEGFCRPTRSPLLLARDALDAYRETEGLRPRNKPASEHYGPLIDKYQGPGRFFTLVSTGCLYYTPDADAAVRRKSDHRVDGDEGGDKAGGNRYEPGGTAPQLVYDVSRIVSVGLGVAIEVVVRSMHELALYRPTFEAALQRARYRPRAVTMDSAGGRKVVSDVTSEYGVAHVSASFGYGQDDNDKWEDDKHGRWDRYGIPRCKHCGAPCRYRKTRHHASSTGEKRWRLMFDCAMPQKEACKQTQSLYLDEDTRILTKLWRDREAWHALRRARGPGERIHHHDRKRFNITGDQHLARRGRKGAAFQQLCCEVVMLLTAMQIAWLQGVIDSYRRVRKATRVISAATSFKKFQRDYRKARLNIPRPDFVKARLAYEASRVRRAPARTNQDE